MDSDERKEVAKFVGQIIGEVNGQARLSAENSWAVPGDGKGVYVCKRRLISEDSIKQLPTDARILCVRTDVIITPSAKDLLNLRKIAIEEVDRQTISFAGDDRRVVKRIVIGADHAAFEMKNALANYVRSLSYRIEDVGTFSSDSVDYPDFAIKVGEAVQKGQCQRGIMVDGAGIGSGMALNKMAGIRAAVCHDLKTVRNSREHNDANVLCIGSGILDLDLAKEMVRVWLELDFPGGRHQRRVDKIMEIEK